MAPNVPVENFAEEALIYLESCRSRLPIESAVLDRWGGAVRIVYGCGFTENCGSRCEECVLYATLGEDLAPAAPDQFRPSLRKANERQLETFSAKQRMMNCKTLDQYASAFVEWLVFRCTDKAALDAEIALVFGFRLLWKGGRRATMAEGNDLRKLVLSRTIRHELLDEDRRRILLDTLAQYPAGDIDFR